MHLTRTPARALTALLTAVLLAGLAADCAGPTDGMYQGGSDAAPGWRK